MDEILKLPYLCCFDFDLFSPVRIWIMRTVKRIQNIFFIILFQLEEFLPIYSQAKKDKDQGCYEDFLECLKLYDKNENGLMLGAELTHTLMALGQYDAVF